MHRHVFNIYSRNYTNKITLKLLEIMEPNLKVSPNYKENIYNLTN